MNQLRSESYTRLETIDLLRGLVMALMLLDHSRDYLHFGTVTEGINPLDPEKSHFGLYLTRWITHLCAPTFLFLAGVSIRLQKERDKPGLSGHLLRRGLWLILMEISLVSMGWTFLPPTRFMVFQVIWAIGISMVCMAAWVKLPAKWVLAFGVLIVGLHNLLPDGWVQPADSPGAWIWTLFHQPGTIETGFSNWVVMVPYAFFPWLGVMMLGYGSGKWFTMKTPTQVSGYAGALLLIFIGLRYLNSFGDPGHWQGQPGSSTFFFTYFDVAKYPPSLLYVLVTLGVSGLIYSLLPYLRGPVKSLLHVFGQVPFFFYLLHIYIVHGLALSLHLLRGGSSADFTFYETFGGVPVGSGFSLPVVYLIWLSLLIVLYFPCKWFAGLKARHRGESWTSFI